MSRIAHSLKEKSRTEDVVITENVDFSSLLLSKSVSQGLANSGFHKPSPIQLKAIPLGRCGLDLIVQAKSGTGKTCVFAVVSLETIQIDSPSTQVLVLAPTREIAVQIWEVINGIGSAISGLKCHTFIGGLPLQEDRMKLKKCHIAVGTPGRVKQLIETGVLKTDSVRLFILDEADKLLEESFQDQINWIYSSLPENKQMLALSATYPEYLADHLTAYMRNPTFLRLNISDPALLGIRQYYKTVPYHPMSHVVFEEKSKALTTILSSVSFQQCLVFSNLQTRAQNLADSLNHKGWPTACIAGCLDQKDRNHAMAKLKTYKCRILISTDLTARGIDADKVNVIINLDIPKDHETYLHRIGRAGRFGSFGIAVTLLSEGQERMDLDLIEKRCNTHINPLPDPIPEDLAHAGSPVHLDDLVSSEVINTDQAARNKNKTNNAERTINDVSKDGKKSGQDTGEDGENNIMNSNHIVGADVTDLDISNSNDINKSESHADEFDGGCKSHGIDGSEAVYNHVNGDITESSSEVSSGQNMLPEKSDNQTIPNKTSCSDDVIDSISDNSKIQKSTENNAGIVDLAEHNETWLNGHETDLINKEDNNVKYKAGSASMDEVSALVGSTTDVGGQGSIVECPDFQGKSDSADLIRTSGANKIKTCNSQQTLSEKKGPQLLADVDKNSQVPNQTDDLDRSLFPSSCVATSNSSVEHTYCNKDYSRFLLFKPPKIDLMSVFKQTIGHKDVKNPHTYETAKAELQSFYTDNTKRLGDKDQPVVMQNQCSKKTAEHEVLMFAVNELQVMFDRAGIAPNTVSDVNVGHTFSFPAAKENKMSLLENVPKADHKEIQKCEVFQSVPSQLLLEGSSRNEMKTPDNEQDMIDSVNVNLNMTTENVVLNDKSNDGVGDVNEGTAKLKPRKQNRRGYAGKFAIAHMLEQTSDKNEGNESSSKTLGNFDIFKDDGVIAKEKLNEGLASNGAGNDDVLSNFVTKSLSEVDIADREADSKDSYQELVLESQAVETLMKDDTVAQTQIAVKAKDQRKVSFSSDEIVTEDSDSDSSSSEEEMPSKTEEHLVDSFQTHINLSKQKENKHLGEVKRAGLELSSVSKKSDTETSRRRRKKEFKINEEAELSDGERETLEEARYTNHERNDETFPQHHPGYPGYPHYPPPGYPPPWQQFPTSHYNQWYPPNYMHFQHHPMQYQQYSYSAFPGPNWPYSVPYSNYDSSIDQSASARNENMKQAFELQSDYIRSMCQNQDQRRKQKNKKKVKK